MILIADSGSTKTDWRVAELGETVKQVKTTGMNPFLQEQEEIAEELRLSLFPEIKEYPIQAVFFYGAGCAFPKEKVLLAEAIGEGVNAPVEVYSDLMGAARGLCGHMAGIACILGTGSNSCRYDGVEIIQHTPPLGFILGDEGSGAALGKRLVNSCLKNQLPASLREQFLSTYELDAEEILDRVYRQPFPNRFLANLSRFLLDHLTEEPIHDLVLEGFKEFLVRNVKPYQGSDQYPIHFTGSIAYFFQSVLREAVLAVGLHPGIITQSPMEGLIRYHSLPQE
ncbi:ATPase [Parabacteroides sp. PF5-6]|uniref:ATPase n=1 Tax=Parabacteroides sp. PF5-6 TaxID=1742403 RepID=UPI002404E363|nr:ATPase [Parabacteroides sp. PF5-6]MDF9828863.1 N-acetylglucosamine kinase-like BadF-type ATPase [Parabacteroides sp. PF5-6]